MNQQCKVCGEPAAGFHFGAFTCEGCKVSNEINYENRNTYACNEYIVHGEFDKVGSFSSESSLRQVYIKNKKVQSPLSHSATPPHALHVLSYWSSQAFTVFYSYYIRDKKQYNMIVHVHASRLGKQ